MIPVGDHRPVGPSPTLRPLRSWLRRARQPCRWGVVVRLLQLDAKDSEPFAGWPGVLLWMALYPVYGSAQSEHQRIYQGRTSISSNIQGQDSGTNGKDHLVGIARMGAFATSDTAAAKWHWRRHATRASFTSALCPKADATKAANGRIAQMIIRSAAMRTAGTSRRSITCTGNAGTRAAAPDRLGT